MRSKSIAVKVIVADAHVAVEQHRHPFAELGFERGVPIHVDHLDLEGVRVLHGLEPKNHLFAKMAVGAPVDGQADWMSMRSGSHSMRSGM